jgi:hypothetical protein
MRVLKGIQKRPVVRKDGSVFIYHYHRATGRRLPGDPSSPEYLAEYIAAERDLSARKDREKTSLFYALEDFKSSNSFRMLPLRVRSEFLSAITWLPPEETSRAVTKITATRARHLRDKAARSRGVRFANCALLLLQSVMDHCTTNGTLAANPAAAIPKFDPPHCVSNNRRLISNERARGRLGNPMHGQNRNGQGVTEGPGS